MNHMKIIRIVISVVIVSYLLIQSYRFVDAASIHPQKETRCGLVTFKGNQTQVHKHSTTTDFILVILYEDTNRKEDETVRAATWSSHKVGDHICLTWDKSPFESIGIVNGIIGIIGCFCLYMVIGVGGLMYGAKGIKWLITGKSSFD